MRLVLAALALWLGAGTGFADTPPNPDERCKQIQELLRAKGLSVDVTLAAADIFDASNRFERPMHMNLRLPVIDKPCMMWKKIFNDGSQVLFSGFMLGKEVIIDTPSHHFEAAFRGQVQMATGEQLSGHDWIPLTQIKNAGESGGTEVEVYHAVGAAIMKEVGFETWESSSGSNYSSLFDLGTGMLLPSRQIGWAVLGVAGKGDKLYQVMVKDITVDFGP